MAFDTNFPTVSSRDLVMSHLMGDSITQIGAEARCIKSRRNWSEFFRHVLLVNLILPTDETA